jgi:hypothetical protein
MGKPIPIKLPPGMFRNGTEYETAGRWYDGNLVRWENGRLKPIGGWEAIPFQGGPLVGIARGGITFTDNHNFPYVLIGTNSNLYLSQGGKYIDETPSDLVPGRVDSILSNGYGSGIYQDGIETYGTPRTVDTLQLLSATWQFDIFGNHAVMTLNSDRRIFEFSPEDGTITVPGGATPTDPPPFCISLMTTNEDFLLALGAGDTAETTVGRRIQWADIGTTTVWTPTDINSAGDINLNSQGICMSGARVGLANLVWTNLDVHLVNFVGQPAIYAPIRIGTACGLIGPLAWAVAATASGAGEAAYWMSHSGFFQYTGAVTPLQCEVQDYIFDNINFEQASKIYASVNSLFHEVIWFFPSKNSQEIDSYVIYDYKDNIWYFGVGSSLARTTYLDRGSVPLPLGVGVDGIVYQHETGYLANHQTRVGQVYIQSGPAEIGDGDRVVYSDMMIVDGDGLVNADSNVLTMTPKARLTPLGPILAANPIPFIPNPEGYTPVRFTGRQIALRFDIVKDFGWSLGKLRLYVVGGSKR